MAKRRDKVVEKPQIESKFLVYIGFLTIFGALGFFIFIMGADFGFFSIEGTDNPFILLGIVVLGLWVEVFADVRYTNAIFSFTNKRSNPLRFIPILGIMTVYYPIYRKLSLVLLVVGILAIIVAFTPLIGLFGITFLLEAPMILATMAFICFSSYFILRGIATIKIKSKVVDLHNKLGGEGASGTTFLRGLFYFFPIARTLPMLQDASFIKTVELMKRDSQKQDQGEY